ncbi:MAG: hypothetical protein QOK14_810, partial [Frankiaceae bacterium]|nr:hypothetical protein [Frankiaceae bacterium]
MSDAPHGPHDLTWFHGCPYCGSATPPGVAACRVCAFPLQDDRAWRVSSLDQAIMDADRRRATLLAERNGLLSTHIPGLPSTHISGPRPTSTHISGPRPTSAP